MEADRRFKNLDKKFWANVRTISQRLGYTTKRTKQIRIYSLDEVVSAITNLGLNTNHLVDQIGNPTPLATLLLDYFIYRADVLNTYVEPRLMNVQRAAEVFNFYRERLNPTITIPLNKQKGEKKAPAYLTGLVNMIIEAYCENYPCDYDPHILTTITQNNQPFRTLSRRVDGCFPSCVNPIAIWEIKEYYYTTTFGSRVADGVYESLLDGLELEELREQEDINIYHLLVVDSHFTWWVSGRSYLCRLIDMLNMGYVDEILFGYEVVERLPTIVKSWVEIADKQN